MNLIGTHLESIDSRHTLVHRCSDLGLPLVLTDLSGRICDIHAAPGGWLSETVIDSPMFRQSLMGVVPQWREQACPARSELWPGCWVMPLPQKDRRRVMGYRVVVILTDALLDEETLHRFADAARIDYAMALKQIESTHLVSMNGIDRLCSVMAWMSTDIDERNQGDSEIGNLSQQLAEAYEELSLVYRMSSKMTVTEDAPSFLHETLTEMQQVIGLKWAALQLSDADDRLQDLRGRTFVAGQPMLEEARLAHVARLLIGRCGGIDESLIVSDPASLEIADLEAGVESMLVVPLVRDNKHLGVMFGADKTDATDLSSVDSKLATSLGQSMAIFLENMLLYEDVQDMFMGTLRTLVSAIDAKDTYTCGHSERVAWLGRELAQLAGLDAHETERLYLAGLLHDFGKIGIPEDVLCKPGKLTDEEYDIIKTHPRIGARMLQDIRQMQDLIPGVLYHHERYDGRGYPDGLEGESIPLFGRLLCLADSFDAMSSTRTYRAAMSREQVLEEIKRCAGTQFDPKLAELFITLDFDPYDRMLNSDKQRTSPLRQELGGQDS